MELYLHDAGTYVLKSSPTSNPDTVREKVRDALARSMQADPGVPFRATQEALAQHRRNPR